MDFTPGGFHNRGKDMHQGTTPTQVQGTRAGELALFVVYESPLACACDSPESYSNQPGADFLKIVPTTWDETVGVDGDIGRYIVMAKRKGDEWFLGAMTDWDSRQLNIPLDFLGTGQYRATVWRDAADANTSAEHLVIETKTLSRTDRLSVNLAPGGGTVVRFVPVAAELGGVWQPKTVKEVTINDAFWTPKLQAYRDNSIRTGWQYINEGLTEVEYVANPSGTKPGGVPWSEALLYKFLEAAAYSVAQWPSVPDTMDPCPSGRVPVANLAAHLNNIATTMQQAQAQSVARGEEGYLDCYVLNHTGELQWGLYPIQPWSNEWNSSHMSSAYAMHEGYALGHLVEAAVAHYNATGSTAMLQVAETVGNQAYNHFITENHPYFCGHAEFELAMVELYRASSRSDRSHFLDVAQCWVDARGQTPSVDGDPSPLQIREYFSDDKPVSQQTAINGHAVRTTFFWTGVADLALSSRSQYNNPAYRVWKNCSKRKLYVTGSAGVYGGFDGHEWEGYSLSDYDLPNGDPSPTYCESCANGAVVNFAHRMGRLKGDSDSIDQLERALYNAVLHGISLDGTGAFYTTTLAGTWGGRGQSWTCCQPLLYRTLLGVGKYIYGYTNSDIYVNLFIGSSCNFTIGSNTVPLTMTTSGYPFDGRVAITVNPAIPTTFALHVRMPGWCRNGLLRLNGKVITKPAISNGYIVLNRQWSSGDQIVFTMAMPVMLTEAHPSVAADTGRVCVQRGPIIYAIESVDNGGGGLQDPVLSVTPEFQAIYNASLLGGVTKITANKQGNTATVTLVPYFALCNRSSGTTWHRVWLKQQSKTLRTTGWEDRLYREYTP